MSASSFVADVAPDASIASARTGVPESVILAQWGIETGWGTSSAWRQGNNYAGVSPGGKVASYSDRAAGLAAYIRTLLDPLYASVRAAGTPDAAARALGSSPWAASHYGGGGADLLSVIQANNLTQYDAAQPAGQPAPDGTTSAPAASTVSWWNPLDQVDSVASAVTDKLAGSLRKPMLAATAVAGGMALIALGGWRAVQPARQAIEQKAQQAGEIAKMAAVA